MENIVYLIGLAAAVWVIYDVWAKRRSMSGGQKIIWTICALFFSVLTAIVYYFVGRK